MGNLHSECAVNNRLSKAWFIAHESLIRHLYLLPTTHFTARLVSRKYHKVIICIYTSQCWALKLEPFIFIQVNCIDAKLKYTALSWNKCIVILPILSTKKSCFWALLHWHDTISTYLSHFSIIIISRQPLNVCILL